MPNIGTQGGNLLQVRLCRSRLRLGQTFMENGGDGAGLTFVRFTIIKATSLARGNAIQAGPPIQDGDCTRMVDEDFLSKEGAVRLAARLQSLYGTRVVFRVEQDRYGVWGVRSDMLRGIPRDGEGHYDGYRYGIQVDNSPTRKSPARKPLHGLSAIEDIPAPPRLRSKQGPDREDV